MEALYAYVGDSVIASFGKQANSETSAEFLYLYFFLYIVMVSVVRQGQHTRPKILMLHACSQESTSSTLEPSQGNALSMSKHVICFPMLWIFARYITCLCAPFHVETEQILTQVVVFRSI
jgi:hypothetical protein